MLQLWVYEKCIEVGDKLTSADVIQTVTEVYNSDRQLSIMQSLSATTTAATTAQNPSVSELQVVKLRHSKNNQLKRTYVLASQARVTVNLSTGIKQYHHTQRMTAQPRMVNATIVRRRDTSRVAASLRKEKRAWKN